MLYWFQRLSYAAFGCERVVGSAAIGFGGVGVDSARLRTGSKNVRPGNRAPCRIDSGIRCSVCSARSRSDSGCDPSRVYGTHLPAFLGRHIDGSRKWWSGVAVACGLAFLTKGPIGLILPAMVVLLYFAWNRELSRVFDRRLALAALVFLLVAAPWYALVTSETRGEWLRIFLSREKCGPVPESQGQARGVVCVLLRYRSRDVCSVERLSVTARVVRNPGSKTPLDQSSSLIPHPSSLIPFRVPS